MGTLLTTMKNNNRSWGFSLSSLQSVIEQMHEVGISGLLETDLVVNSNIQRFKPDGATGKSGWYVLHEYVAGSGQVIITGAFGDHRLGDDRFTVKNEGLKLSQDEREKFKRANAERKRQTTLKQKRRAESAARWAESTWDKLSQSGKSPYLERKRVHGYDIRYRNKTNAIAIPMRDMSGKLYGMQVIHAEKRTTKDGIKIDKDFWPYGSSPKNHFHQIGRDPKNDDRVVVCEGYATGASIHEATGYTVYVAFNVGNLMNVATLVRETYPDAVIIVAADDDYLTTRPTINPGISEAKKVIRKVKGIMVKPVFKNRNGEKWTDFNDLYVQEDLNQVKKQFKELFNTSFDNDIPTDGWLQKLSRADNGTIRADINNVRLILENDERWKGVLRYNSFDNDILKTRKPPFEFSNEVGEWTEVDINRLQCWMSENYNFTPKPNDALGAVLVTAEHYQFHPVLDYLESLKWDNKERLDNWLTDYMGASDTEYNKAVARKWMIGAVARVHAKRGQLIKMDNVLILEGAQGAGKSTALDVLAGGWFSDTHFDLGSTEGLKQLAGVWIYELAELDAFNKAESTRAKAFFSAKEDNYRPSYGKRNQRFPRQCVFAGTTNQGQYLKDVTGNRRYWPVTCLEIDLQGLREARDQLWAEALHYYKTNIPWNVLETEKDLFEEQQEARFSEDTWESKIFKWLYDATRKAENFFTSANIMEGALDMTAPQMKPPEQTRVGFIMSRLKWEKKRKRLAEYGKKPMWVYVRPEKDWVLPNSPPRDDDVPPV